MRFFVPNIILCLVFFAGSLNAQTVYDTIRIKGNIRASLDSTPVKQATISLLSGATIESKMTLPDGSFMIETHKIPDSILINAFGFDPVRITIEQKDKSIIDLGQIFIKLRLSAHEQATVIGARSVVFGLNKITYNIQTDASNKGLPVLEVLQKVPLVDIGSNDKIYVNGRMSFIVLVDGRNSGITGLDPATYLKTLQSSAISRIEIITDPPARYKNEGYDYVINIIMNKKRANGLYGSVTSGANTFGGYSGNSLLMLKWGRLNLTSTLYYSRSIGRPGDFFYQNDNRKTGYTITQEGINENRSKTLTFSSELTYEVDTVKLFSAAIYSSNSRLNTITELSNSYLKNNAEYALIRRDGTNKEHSGFRYASADYEIMKNKKRDVLTFSGKWYHVYANGNNQSNDVNTGSGRQTKLFNIFRTTGNEYTVQGDLSKYIDPVYSLELGVKEIIREYDAENINSGLSANSLNYKQNVSVVYGSSTYRKKNGSFKLGLSLNHAYFKYNETMNSKQTDFTYFSILPYFNLAHLLKKNKSFSVNYTMTVRRPGLGYLSPIIRYVNPENLQSGNPGLRPELFHSIDFFYNTFLKKKALILGAGASYSDNAIVELIKPYQDSLTLKTFTNNGRYLKLNFSISYSIALSKRLSFRLNSDLGYPFLKNKSMQLQNDGVVYKAFLTLTCQLPWNLRLSSQNYIYSRDYSLQGWTENFTDLRFYLSRKFINDNMNVGITWYQPYSNTIKLESKYEDDDFRKYSWSEFPSRYLGISISYDFGDFGKVMKRQKKRTIVNTDVK